MIKGYVPKSLIASIDYDKKVAKSFHKTGFYNYEEDRLAHLFETHLEKKTLKAPHQLVVSELINEYVAFGKAYSIRIFKVLTGIRNKNIENIKEKLVNPPKHRDLINIIANPYI